VRYQYVHKSTGLIHPFSSIELVRGLRSSLSRRKAALLKTKVVSQLHRASESYIKHTTAAGDADDSETEEKTMSANMQMADIYFKSIEDNRISR
jgi:hypothetical protein